MSREEAQWLICIVFIFCALGFYGYKYWNASPAPAIIGKAWVIDGDTVVISGTHIRLEGIDAPEMEQTCTDADGNPWPCGRIAMRELRAFVRRGDLTCDKRAMDRYKRVLAVCKLPDERPHRRTVTNRQDGPRASSSRGLDWRDLAGCHQPHYGRRHRYRWVTIAKARRRIASTPREEQRSTGPTVRRGGRRRTSRAHAGWPLPPRHQ